uniref:DUF3421 domain-containing protein n=1 Tax=Schistosoma mansoni TaxID=6183 RepID=A0A5K4F826_SCHMA
MAKIGKGIQIPLSWVPDRNGNVPHNAISVTNGIYVVRCQHDRQWIPGKAANGHDTAYYPYGGEEKNTKEYEVLCDTSFSGHQGYILSFSDMNGYKHHVVMCQKMQSLVACQVMIHYT